MIHWKQINEYIEPNWEKINPEKSPATLFWRGAKGAVYGHIRDGELFDHKWVYVCDSNKVTHFSEINGPESNVVEMAAFQARVGASPFGCSDFHPFVDASAVSARSSPDIL
ncbi:MAG: hypothetical protein WDN31_13095 [Hyphomicrobium sp.]